MPRETDEQLEALLESPTIERRVRIDRLQLICVPIMVLVSALGLAGVFGASRGEARSPAGPADVRVSYPNRIGDSQEEALDVVVGNAGQAAMRDVALAIDAEYLDAFSISAAMPGPSELTPNAYVFRLGDIPAGRARRMVVFLKAVECGGHGGDLVVQAGGRALARIRLTAVIFP